MAGRPNIVLVHGAWADGSCRSGVIERLQAGDCRIGRCLTHVRRGVAERG